MFRFLSLALLAVALAACSAAATLNPAPATVRTAPATPTRSIITIPASPYTPTARSIPTTTPQLEGPLVAFMAASASGDYYVLILDLDSGLTRRIPLGYDILGYNGISSIAWSPDGCQLLIGAGDRILITDLKGNVLSMISAPAPDREGSSIGSGSLTVSPARDWMAYTVLSGGQHCQGAEFQNIEVIATDEQMHPFKLTSHGGAWLATWSPDGQDLAYSEYDATGAVQLYRAKPNGNDWMQLTSFTNDGSTIGEVQWSPQSDTLAFVVYDADRSGALWLVSSDGSQSTKVEVEAGGLISDRFWWSADGRRLAFYSQRSDEFGVRDDAIYWIDAKGDVIHVLEASKTPEKHIAQPFPVGDINTMGFIGNESFFFYDMATGAFKQTQYSVEFADLIGRTHAVPVTFQSEAACQIN